MKLFVALAGLFGMLGVAAGAFGAHGLEGRVEPDMLEVWETAATYQMYHAIALLGVAWLTTQTDTAWAIVAGWVFAGGVLVFSGTLYAMVATGARWLGAITPIGGLALIAGWFCCLMAAVRGLQ